MLDFLNSEDLLGIIYFYILPVLAVVGYLCYYRKYSFYELKDPFVEGRVAYKVARGRCPPSYPNGWYRLCRSNELKTS